MRKRGIKVAAGAVLATVLVLGLASFALASTSPPSPHTSSGSGAPAVASISPRLGRPAGGNEVTILGAKFVGVTSVMFGTVPATSYTVDSPNKIVAVAPAGTADTKVDVTVTTAAGTSKVVATDKYAYKAADAPTVVAISPKIGKPAGGNQVTILGAKFVGVTSVMFGTVPATSYTVSSPNKIVAVAPAGTAGTKVDVTVTTAAGTSKVVATDKYCYAASHVTTGA